MTNTQYNITTIPVYKRNIELPQYIRKQ